MILNETVVLRITNKNINWYSSKGYQCEFIKKMEVYLEDLQKTSNVSLDVRCDYCGSTFKRKYCDIVNGRKNIPKDACRSCYQKKFREVNVLLFGVEHPSQRNSFHESMRDMKIFDIDYVKDFVDENSNATLLSRSYSGCYEKLLFRCECGNEFITSFTKFKSENKRQCDECGIAMRSGENNAKWRGGITPLHNFLRNSSIISWKKDSMESCNYKCVVTGAKMEVIHHLYNFSNIMNETLSGLDIPIKTRINEYTTDELNAISSKCLELHYKYPLGVCLTKDIHNLYHSIYGKENNTPEQFYEFVKRYKTGEFSKEVKSHE